MKESLDSNAWQSSSPEINTRLRDLEEKNRLLKDRILMIGENFVNDKETLFSEMQDMKKTLITLKEDHLRLKEFLQRMTELVNELARKEEVMIIQRQIDILKPQKWQ